MEDINMKLGLLPKIILAIILAIIAGSFAPDAFLRVFITFNNLFGNFLGFAIPLIIVGFIAPGIASLGKGAGKMLGITTSVAYLSTIGAGLIAFFTATFLYPTLLKGQSTQAFENPEEALLSPFFTVEMPPVIDIMSALLLAFTLGIGLTVINGHTLKHAMYDFREIIEKVIEKVIIPLLPLHIFGIFANMTQGGQAVAIMSVFLKVFLMILALHILYLFIQFSVAGSLAKRNPFIMMKNMVPAYMTALGTQSSASTIPVTLKQTKQLGTNERVADFSVPLLATIHLSGSTITLVSCGIAVMMLQGQSPGLGTILPFILMLGITMIAAPGVPGGAVMATLGLLESMLGFDPTMISLMIALYLAQDSFGTACNVTGDGALSMIVDKLSGTKSRRSTVLKEKTEV